MPWRERKAIGVGFVEVVSSGGAVGFGDGLWWRTLIGEEGEPHGV